MKIVSSKVALIMLFSASCAFAQSGVGFRGKGMMNAGWGQSCLAQVDLNSQQVGKILAILKEFDPIREKNAVEIRALMIQLRNLNISKSEFTKISEAEAKIANIKAEEIKLYHNQWARIDAVLTPAQRIACTAEYESKMGMDFSRGGMMGMGHGW
jgi:hypothetical protein